MLELVVEATTPSSPAVSPSEHAPFGFYVVHVTIRMAWKSRLPDTISDHRAISGPTSDLHPRCPAAAGLALRCSRTGSSLPKDWFLAAAGLAPDGREPPTKAMAGSRQRACQSWRRWTWAATEGTWGLLDEVAEHVVQAHHADGTPSVVGDRQAPHALGPHE